MEDLYYPSTSYQCGRQPLFLQILPKQLMTVLFLNLLLQKPLDWLFYNFELLASTFDLNLYLNLKINLAQDL